MGGVFGCISAGYTQESDCNWTHLGYIGESTSVGKLGVNAHAGEQFGNIGAIGTKLIQGYSGLEYLLPVTQ
jgi:hypothetical protein